MRGRLRDTRKDINKGMKRGGKGKKGRLTEKRVIREDVILGSQPSVIKFYYDRSSDGFLNVFMVDKICLTLESPYSGENMIKVLLG